MEAVSVCAPSSKSVSHRMLIAAALAEGESVISRVLESRDVQQTRAVLQAAGARMEEAEQPGSWRIQGMAGKALGGPAQAEALSCDVYESGTTCRLLTAVLAAGQGYFRIHGAPRMHRRPIGALTQALSAQGAVFSFEGEPGYPPFVLESSGLCGGSVNIGLEESSQYLSGLLLAAPLAAAPLTLEISGSHVVSWPYVGLTLQTLRDFGARFDVSTREPGTEHEPNGGWKLADWRGIKAARPGLIRFRVRPSAYRAGRYTVEGDWSGASYLLAAGALGSRPVAVVGLKADTLQGDRAIRDILVGMGADVRTEPAGREHGPALVVFPSVLRGVEVHMASCPDLVPTVAVLAAAAEGDTVIRGVAHLRIKESDRIAAPAAELRKAGVKVEERDDGLVIHGMGHGTGRPDLTGKHLDLAVWGDHRMAMSLSLLECLGAEVSLDHPEVVDKSFPDFWDVWRRIRTGKQ